MFTPGTKKTHYLHTYTFKIQSLSSQRTEGFQHRHSLPGMWQHVRIPHAFKLSLHFHCQRFGLVNVKFKCKEKMPWNTVCTAHTVHWLYSLMNCFISFLMPGIHIRIQRTDCLYRWIECSRVLSLKCTITYVFFFWPFEEFWNTTHSLGKNLCMASTHITNKGLDYWSLCIAYALHIFSMSISTWRYQYEGNIWHFLNGSAPSKSNSIQS